MTPEEIRAEAIDRAARALYAAWKAANDRLAAAMGLDPTPSYDEGGDGSPRKQAFRAHAEVAVDALGDMIPTGRQWAARYPGDVITRGTSTVRANVENLRTANNDVTIESQWTHDWQEDPA